MSSVRDMTFSTSVPDDLARRLRPSGVREIVKVLWDSYHLLRDDARTSYGRNTDEDLITQEWYAKIACIWSNKNRATCIRMAHFGPMHQYGDPTLKKKRGKMPTIDFCFRDWDTSNSYFGIECKKLYDKNANLLKRYVETGVNNYITGRYGSCSTESCVAGYVLSGAIDEEANALAPYLNATAPVKPFSRNYSSMNPEYLSQHVRQLDGAVIKLRHLFLDFT